MEKLPPELTQIICSNLTPKDLKSARLTTKQLAASGACYILPRVFVFSRKESLNELKEIAQHPTFSKCVTTLIFDATLLKDFGDDFCSWNKARPNTCYVPRWVDFEPYLKTIKGSIDSRSDRAMRRTKTQFKQACDRCPIQPAVIERMWTLYRSLVSEQRSQDLRKLRKETMELVFSLCPNIDHIIIGDDHRLLKKNRVRLFADIPMRKVGLKPNVFTILNDISAARASAGRTMQRLTIPLESMFGTHWGNLSGTSLPDATTETLENLKVFTLNILRCFISDPQYGAGYCIFRKLQCASQLEVLKINLHARSARNWHPWNFRSSTTRLHNLIKDAHWPALHTIKLIECCGTENLLVGFLLRHERSLQALAFKDCNVSEGNWTSLFTRIARKLPLLKQVRLVGWLSSGAQLEFNLHSHGNFNTSIAMELEAFIIEGGIIPLDASLKATAELPRGVPHDPFDDDEEEDYQEAAEDSDDDEPFYEDEDDEDVEEDHHDFQ